MPLERSSAAAGPKTAEVEVLQVALWWVECCLAHWVLCLHLRYDYWGTGLLLITSRTCIVSMWCTCDAKAKHSLPINHTWHMPAMICAAVHVSFYYIQISRAILGQDQKLRLPKFLEEEEKSPEATKQVRSCSIACMSAHSSASCHTVVQAIQCVTQQEQSE